MRLTKTKSLSDSKKPLTAVKPAKRIELLDSFRFLAIIVVILFHYFSSKVSIPNIYPYGLKYRHLFMYGYMGVQLFYMISGFVIFMTIEKCKTLKEFLIRRLIRLWPLLFLCSIVTFLGIRLVDSHNDFPVLKINTFGFLPSLTFIDPFIYSSVLSEKVTYIDNVHWSLLVEVKFYIVFGILYFFNREKILWFWFIFTALISIIHLLDNFTSNSILHFFSRLDDKMNFGRHLVFFTAGIVNYILFCNRSISKPLSISLIILCFVQCYLFLSPQQLVLFTGFIILFLLFVYKPSTLSFLNVRLFSIIGLVSYPLYLLHNFLGTTLIYKIASLLHLKEKYNLMIVPVVIVFFIIISYVIDKYYDNKVQKSFKKVLL